LPTYYVLPVENQECTAMLENHVEYPIMNRMDRTEKRKSHLIGLGLDNEDGHKRITQAEDFSIVGGSEETHERLTETAMKTVEDLSRKGKTIHNAEESEVREIIMKHSES